jgi:hypothetical protein
MKHPTTASNAGPVEGHQFVAGGRIVFTDAELEAQGQLQMPFEFDEDPDKRPYIWDLPGDRPCR